MRRSILRNPRLFRSSSEKNVLFIGVADLTLSTGRIDGGLLIRSVLEDILASVCDSGVVGVSISYLCGGMISGRCNVSVVHTPYGNS